MSEKEIHSYRDLLVWQRDMELTKAVYAATRAFPEDERFGLTAQLRRSSLSVPSNIAEGQARQSTKEFVRFLYVAKGSLAELDTQLLIAREFDYVPPVEYDTIMAMIDALQRMLYRLIERLQEDHL